ncbi:hypothetical protein L596_012838 [Steinernema carpocapsae]|uniref:Serpentine receptor class gamma n=1 Tax=Steinernema carpocapsae TaxID=34508 RepID=A0A4U5NYA8_STECR|nr:hypothetical protein L596_012838 [Steinernema carpocapsae]
MPLLIFAMPWVYGNKLASLARLLAVSVSNALIDYLPVTSMELYLFRHETYRSLYNCSYLSDEEWWARGKPDVIYGISLLLIVSLFTILYIPCLIVIYRSKLFEYAGYKLMFYVGLIDVNALLMSSGFTGYYTIIGAMPCPHMDLSYFISLIGNFNWASQSTSVIILALNRCVELWKPSYITNTFEGRRTYFWIGASILYSMYYLWFGTGLLYNSAAGHNWYPSPYYRVEGLEHIDYKPYVSLVFLYHDIVTGVLLIILYSFLVGSIWWKGRLAGGSLSKIQTLISIQSFCLCCCIVTVVVIYALMWLVEISKTGAKIASVVWQISNGISFQNIILKLEFRCTSHHVSTTEQKHPRRRRGIVQKTKEN